MERAIDVARVNGLRRFGCYGDDVAMIWHC